MSEDTAPSSVRLQAPTGMSVGRIWRQPAASALVPSPSQDSLQSFLLSTAHAHSVLKRYQSKRNPQHYFSGHCGWSGITNVPTEGKERH